MEDESYYHGADCESRSEFAGVNRFKVLHYVNNWTLE